jgi:hypothetical protein
MRKIKSLLIALIFVASVSSCYQLEHVVGDGAQGSQTVSKKQWYALWGLVPINNVDSKQMAGDAEDYTITSKHKFVDLVISAVTSYVTIVVQSVDVEK